MTIALAGLAAVAILELLRTRYRIERAKAVAYREGWSDGSKAGTSEARREAAIERAKLEMRHRREIERVHIEVFEEGRRFALFGNAAWMARPEATRES